ncbi:MAG: SRPBCC family protein [Planctomycetaceae bacterium]
MPPGPMNQRSLEVWNEDDRSIRMGKHPSRRGMFRLESEVWLPAGPEAVFDFFANPENLEAITPPWLNFRIMTPTPIEMRAGVLIDYRIRLHGVPIKWRTEISVWEPPLRFVDEQLRGPYRFWHHEHTFVEQDGGTLVGDCVDYAVLGGAIVHRLFVRNDLEKIFTYRLQKLTEFFTSSPVEA